MIAMAQLSHTLNISPTFGSQDLLGAADTTVVLGPVEARQVASM